MRKLITEARRIPMAHSCPECGQACYCNGDIDDILFDDQSDQALGCNHCTVDDAKVGYSELDDLESESCPHCGKAYEDFSDLGCGFCDRRSPDFL
jgi:rubrerythrin